MAYIKVEGTVTRTIGENELLGFEMEETATNHVTGQSWPVKYTIWQKGTTVKPGAMVEVRGELGLKSKAAELPDGTFKRNPVTGLVVIYTDRNVNDPEVKVLRAAPADAGINERPNWDESPF